MRPATPEAVKLFHEGTLALSEIEKNGIRIDTEYLEKALKKTAHQIRDLTEEFKETKVFKKWEKMFRGRISLGNKHQLEEVVFDGLGYKRSGNVTAKSGKPSANKAAFEKVDRPDVRLYFRIQELEKARGTYLLGIQKELVGQYIYPFLDLHIPMSYRSSAKRPNIQNFPVRNLDMANIVRTAIIPPDGYEIGEIDYGGIEVCGSACYHRDPKMIDYIVNPKTDMHRDMAMQIFKLKKVQVSKLVRYSAKNGFVFPEFYGSYYVDCARNMWDMIELLKLQTEQGEPLRKHLAKQGIKTLKQFESHVELVEKDFWERRFRVYKQWKYDFFESYLDQGWFRFKTGFISAGMFDRKQVCNYPIQGSSFHCLLWALIRLMKWMQKHNMKSKIIAEIHDSILFYFHPKEKWDIISKAVQIMTKDILEHWKWIIVPLTVEVEIAPKGESWVKKEKVKIPA